MSPRLTRCDSSIDLSPDSLIRFWPSNVVPRPGDFFHSLVLTGETSLYLDLFAYVHKLWYNVKPLPPRAPLTHAHTRRYMHTQMHRVQVVQIQIAFILTWGEKGKGTTTLHYQTLLSVGVELLLKKDGGYPKDAGVKLVEHPGNSWEFHLLQHPLVSSASHRPRPFQGTRRAAGGGALAPRPSRTTNNQPDSIRIFGVSTLFLQFLSLL